MLGKLDLVTGDDQREDPVLLQICRNVRLRRKAFSFLFQGSLFEPLFSCSIVPDASLAPTLDRLVSPLTMLLAILPASHKCSPISPSILAVTILLIHHKMTSVLPPIWPFQRAITMHGAFAPLALVLSSIAPSVFAIASQHVLYQLTNVAVPIFPLKLTLAMLLSFEVLSLIDRSIRERLIAISVLHVIFPATFILRSISMQVVALAIGLAVDPVHLLNIALCMYESTTPICFAILPMPLVDCAVWPRLHPTTILKALFISLSLIRNPLIKTFLDGLVCLLWLVVSKFSQLFPDLLHCRHACRLWHLFLFFLYLSHSLHLFERLPMKIRDHSDVFKIDLHVPQEIHKLDSFNSVALVYINLSEYLHHYVLRCFCCDIET